MAAKRRCEESVGRKGTRQCEYKEDGHERINVHIYVRSKLMAQDRLAFTLSEQKGTSEGGTELGEEDGRDPPSGREMRNAMEVGRGCSDAAFRQKHIT